MNFTEKITALSKGVCGDQSDRVFDHVGSEVKLNTLVNVHECLNYVVYRQIMAL